MKLRSKSGGGKTGRRKATTPPRLISLKSSPTRRSTEISQTEIARLSRERNEALEREKATAEVLHIISSSPGELEPVFQAMLANALRICEAKFGTLYLSDGEMFNVAASMGAPPELAAFHKQRGAFRPRAGALLDRVMNTKQVAHIADAASFEVKVAELRFGGTRSYVAVPMLKENELIGVIVIYRTEVRPFTDKQIDLVKNFAAQAVIAIENARLLNELRESLGQQTATADVLRVISSSLGELEPVFQALLEKAVRICDAKFGILHRYEDGGFRLGAAYNPPRAWVEARQRDPVLRPGPLMPLGRVAATKQLVQIADLTEDAAYMAGATTNLVVLAGARTLLIIPMLKGDQLIGVISIYRQEVRPFTEKQVKLIQNFAAQAVIAIENARLLNELHQRTADLSESLEQQTATSEVLKVISSSPGDLEPVFETILENATRICEAKFANLYLFDGKNFHFRAEVGTPPALAEFQRQRGPFQPLPGGQLDRVVRTKRVSHTADYSAEAVHGPSANLGGARTTVHVPMLKDDILLGAILIYRLEVRAFTDKQIELVQNFAAQAVIAIENARLLNELRQRTTDLGEALERQTATSQVLQVISSSPIDLVPVFQAALENATRLCGANFGQLFLFDGEMFRPAATHNTPEKLAEFVWQRGAFRPQSGTPFDALLRMKEVVSIADDSTSATPGAAARYGGARSVLAVPMVKENTLVGAFIIYRQEVRPFTDKQIELVQNFAAQAVIAIENTRLLNDLNKLNQQLEQRVADQVGEIERMGRLRRFLPPQVADLIVASGTEKQLESHRREITALFCDLRGFTGFSESSDPEDVMALLRDYHAAIGKIIIKYSGTLERYAGDGVMVVFNDPVPVENPAMQAVLMALEMRETIGALIEKWKRLGHDLGFGIGIAHGFATLGTIGFEGRFDYAAIGTVSNVASRLCDEAKPGQILISPRVLMAVEKAVTVEPVGEFTLKGIRRPMSAFNVLASAPSQS